MRWTGDATALTLGNSEAEAMLIGLALEFAGLNAVKMLSWSAVLNGVVAPPLVVLLTSDKRVMGERVNPGWMRRLGWIRAGRWGSRRGRCSRCEGAVPFGRLGCARICGIHGRAR